MAHQYKTFNKKRYSLHGDDNRKDSALSRAKALRQHGHRARVVKFGEYYRIYTRG